jgi:hypothetical protein
MISLLVSVLLPVVQEMPIQIDEINRMGAPPAGEFAAVGMIMMLVFFLVSLLFIILLFIAPVWIICKKAGLPGPLSLLLLVPLVNIVFFWILALINWPALENRGQGRESSPFQSG